MEKQIKLLIFDYDDTIIERDQKKMLMETFSNLDNSKEISEYILKKFEYIKNIKEIIKKTFEYFNIEKKEDEIKNYAKNYVHQYENGKIKEKIKHILSELSKKYILVILSNGNKEIKIRELKNNNCLDLFKEVFTHEDTNYQKPDPRAFDFILKKYNLKSQEAVSIGNSLSMDILPAKQIGIKTIWLYNTKPDKILSHLEELDDSIISKL